MAVQIIEHFYFCWTFLSVQQFHLLHCATTRADFVIQLRQLLCFTTQFKAVSECRDIGEYLEVFLSWIQPIHQNLSGTQWSRVGNNKDYRDKRFVYGYVALPL